MHLYLIIGFTILFIVFKLIRGHVSKICEKDEKAQQNWVNEQVLLHYIDIQQMANMYNVKNQKMLSSYTAEINHSISKQVGREDFELVFNNHIDHRDQWAALVENQSSSSKFSTIMIQIPFSQQSDLTSIVDQKFNRKLKIMLSQSSCHNKMYMLKFTHNENEISNQQKKYMTYEYFDRDYLNQIDKDETDL